MVILEEVNLPHPRCSRCNMLVNYSDMNRRHLAIAQCSRGAKRKRRKLSEKELRERSERAFKVYGEPLENVTSFKYMGRGLNAGDDDWLAVAGNLQKARKSWVRISRILNQEVADPKLLIHFFKAVLQAVLLFRSGKWVLNPWMEQALGIFQNRVARRLTGMQLRQRGEGRLEHPPLAAAMGESGL